VLAVLCVVLVLTGVGFLAYPTWTDIRASRAQHRLEEAFATPRVRDNAERGTVTEGDPVTRILIPSLGVDALVVEGITEKALEAGAGHYPQTPLPGQPGNVAVAGHRTTFGQPFENIDRLRVGDEIVLVTPVGRYTYHVSQPPWVTDPADWRVVGPTESGGPSGLGSALTLTTCTPKGSADQRLIVRASLASGVPV
jgi:sortase A